MKGRCNLYSKYMPSREDGRWADTDNGFSKRQLASLGMVWRKVQQKLLSHLPLACQLGSL